MLVEKISQYLNLLFRLIMSWFFVLFPLFLLGGWLLFVGSYSWTRDLVGMVAAGMLLYATWRIVSRRPQALGGNGAARSWSRDLFHLTAGWTITSWLLLGVLDFVFERHPVPLRGAVSSPETTVPRYAAPRVALALSGGGYRAALVHAGVIDQLGRFGVPVDTISSVSGASILAAFVARGGDPMDFVAAVRDGRFRLRRELLSPFSLPFWLNPFGDYSRRDVQASMVRRVLLSQPEGTGNIPAGPSLMVSATDLVRGMSLGFTQDGVLFAGPVSSRFFAWDEAVIVDDIGDLADLVAVSGSFPGAFPAFRTKAKFTVDGVPLSLSENTREIQLALADGGIRDNLGLKLLESARKIVTGENPLSSSWSAYNPGPGWSSDVIIVSDGGKALEADDIGGALEEVSRAIDLVGLDTGVLRLVEMNDDLPKVFLSQASRIAPTPDAVLAGYPWSASEWALYDFFRPYGLPDGILDQIVKLVPDQAAAREAFARFPKDPSEVNTRDERCFSGDAAHSDLPSCRWWTLVRVVGADIVRATDVFRKTETLEDTYSSEDADALVRLGRYFVLLAWKDISEGLDRVTERANAAEAGNAGSPPP